MQIAKGVEMLELEYEGFGGRNVLNPTLIWDDEIAILVDAGMPGSWEMIQRAMAQAGVSPSKLKAIILTHQDFDHIGSLPEIIEAQGGQIQVYAHKLDQPYIEGTLPLIKTTPERMAKVLAPLPDEERQKAMTMFANPPKVKVDQTLEDKEVLPFCGGIEVVFTPGHTPGHISLYLKRSKTLVAGDALMYISGSLRGPAPQNTLDMEQAHDSLKKFLVKDIASVICYHGGNCQDHIRDQLLALVK